MHNPESVLETEPHKILSDFDLQTDNLIAIRQPALVIVNSNKKENLPNSGLCYSGCSREREKREKYLDLAREVKKQWHMKVTLIPIKIGALGTVTKRTGGLGNKCTG